MKTLFSHSIFRWAALFVILGSLCGCGGGSDTATTPVTTRVQFDINWSARSRSVTGPSSALSAHFSLKSARAENTDLNYVVNRNTDPATYNKLYTTSEMSLIGIWEMSIRFYSLPEGSGTLVGEARTLVSVKADGTLGKPSDGSPLGNITLSGIVDSVRLDDDQTIQIGMPSALSTKVYDKTNNLVVLEPGAIFLEVKNGNNNMRIANGLAEGLSPGKATVTATVDGKTSPEATVNVASAAVVTILPDMANLVVNGKQSFSATVVNAPNAAVVWTISEGLNGGAISVAGAYTAPPRPGVFHIVATSVYDPHKSSSATVTVTAPVQVIAINANDLIYDQNTKMIYATVPSSDGSRGNTITAINTAGIIGNSVPVGSEPGLMAQSDDGHTIYLALDGEAAVRRYDLSTQTPGMRFSLGRDSFFGSYYVDRMVVLQGNPSAVAISRKNLGISPRHAGVAIYDNGVIRAKVTQVHTGSDVLSLAASATRLYGYNNESTEFGFRRLNVDSMGVTELDVTPNLIAGFGAEIRYDSGRVYSSTGHVIDPEALTLLGRFSGDVFSSFNVSIAIDKIQSRAYFLSKIVYGTAVIQVYDSNTFLPVGSLEIPGVQGEVGSLIRWGAKGLAFRSTQSQLFLVNEIPGI